LRGDFGLAKRKEVEAGGDDPTRAVAVTQAGMALGTIAYMSPEQARGQSELTPQSDQFTFGLVLYELATGKRAFQRSLYRELRQLRERLTETTAGSGIHPAAIAEMTQKPAVPRKSRAVLGYVGVAVLAGLAPWLLHPGGDAVHARFTPMEVSVESPRQEVWSPDGKAFAFSAGPEGERRVYLRYLDNATATPLTQPGKWFVVGWSPDSKRVVAGTEIGAGNATNLELN
jgi:serine/threonine protein kinase